MIKEILIADSDKSDQEKYQKIFETTHYHLVFSESGEDVLLRVKLFKPDLIIAGTALSEKNGFELCEVLKGDPEFRYIPFILLVDDFEEISGEERKRLKPDGVLSKPLHKGEVQDMVNRLLKKTRAKGEGIPGKEEGWDSSADMNKEDFLLDELAERGEEEIIDLVDVVEEAEPRMSIDDFAISGKEETYGEITSLESWGKLEEEEKVEMEERFVLSLKEEEREKEKAAAPLKKEATPKQDLQDEELFEKIELKDIEEILEKVGQTGLPSEMGVPLERGVSVGEEPPSIGKEEEEKELGLEEFEALLKKGVEAETTEGESLKEAFPTFSAEAQEMEAPEEITPIEIPETELEEFAEEKLEGLVEEALEEVAEEEFPEELLEEALEEEKVEPIEELEEEEFEEAEAEELEVIAEPVEEKFDLFEGLEALEVSKEEIRVTEGRRPAGVRRVEKVEAPATFEEGIAPPPRGMEQETGGVISERVRVMMEEFIAKHVPEMTKDIIGLTMERIEKMVREIVPDLAAKMIEEEIKRLEKGEKV